MPICKEKNYRNKSQQTKKLVSSGWWETFISFYFTLPRAFAKKKNVYHIESEKNHKCQKQN